MLSGMSDVLSGDRIIACRGKDWKYLHYDQHTVIREVWEAYCTASGVQDLGVWTALLMASARRFAGDDPFRHARRHAIGVNCKPVWNAAVVDSRVSTGDRFSGRCGDRLRR